jgi:hypothetical protein
MPVLDKATVSGIEKLKRLRKRRDPDGIEDFNEVVIRSLGLLKEPSRAAIFHQELKKALGQDQAALDSTTTQDNTSMLSGIEKLKLVKELGGIRSAIKTVASGIEKLGLVKRIKEIRVLLGGKVDRELSPASPEDYAKIMADHELQLQYQDILDSFFQSRIVDVRNALRDLGWEGRNQSDARLYKGDAEAQFTFTHVGAGANVAGYSVNDIADDLTKTPEQFATKIDAAAMAETESRKTEINNISRADLEGYEKAKELGEMPKYVPNWIDEIDNGDQAIIDAYMGGARRWLDEHETIKPATIADVNEVMPLLKQFIGQSQLSAMGSGVRGEEGQFFKDKFIEVANVIKSMPKTYDTDGQGDKAVAYLHYFKAGADWYITEKDTGDVEDAKNGISGQVQAFGLADLGYGGEMGYISIEELIRSGVELDLYWTPKTIGQIKGKNDEPETENEPVPVPGNSDMVDPPAVEEKEPQVPPKPMTELDKQRAKLQELAAFQEQMKAANKILKSSKLSDEQKAAQLAALGYSEGEIYKLMKPDFAGRIGYSYHLTNNNAVIRNTQKRIAELEARELAESRAASGDRPTSYEFDGGTVELDYADDRIKVYFDAKPDSDMRTKLKSNGFNWSPTNSAWQRKITDNAIYATNRLLGTDIKTAESVMKDTMNQTNPSPIVPPPAVEETKFSVGDTVYMQDITDENKRIPVNFRGYMDKEKSIVVWNGSQMAIETSRLFKEDIKGDDPVPQANPIKAAFEAELSALKLENDIESYLGKLEAIAGRIEAAGLMEEMDGILNETADQLTSLMAEAEKNAA